MAENNPRAQARIPRAVAGSLALPSHPGLRWTFRGFSAAVIRTRAVEGPVLPHVHIAPLAGVIEQVEERPAGARLILRVLSIDGLPERERPHRVRVTVREAAGLSAGQAVAATARLLPPTDAAWPGGYDFARDAYFRGIGAIGSVAGRVRVLPLGPELSWSSALSARVDAARTTLARRIAAAIGGPAGAVAAALVTGKRGFIEEETNDILRGAGIYHIVSISGLHMVLAAGTFFWLSRAVLALFPAAAVLWSVKKIAGGVAMVGATAYCIFSGAEVATERSLIMTLVMFCAILVDRAALSMRNLAIAALIVLVREPEALIGPSFQMSFGAVAALIALAGWLQPRLASPEGGGLVTRLMFRAARSLLGLLAVTLVAGLATAPFAAYHFQAVNPFGLVGNALALPLVSLAVMPAALLGVLAYPFGLDRFVWMAMGAAVEGVLQVSAWVASFPGSNTVVAAFGPGALLLFAAALLLVSLFATPLRWAAVLPAAAGLALAAHPQRFDLYVDREGAGAAVRGRASRLVLLGRPSAFVIEQWLRADGDARGPSEASLREGIRCDRSGCVARLADGRAVSFVREPSAFEEDCRRAAIVISRLTAPPGCRAALVIDGPALRERGATAVRLSDDGFAIAGSRQAGEARPWDHAGRSRAAPASGGAGAPPVRTASPEAAADAEPELSSAERD
jgi:competence protein ComEC